MIIILKQGSTPEQVEGVESTLKEMGYGVHPIYGVERTVIGAVGAPGADKEAAADQLRALEAVADIVFVLKPYKFVAKEFKSEKSVVRAGDVEIGGNRVVVMAGPCTVESREQLLKTARAVKAAGATVLRGGAYKPSTSPYSFQGMGLDGLKLLAEAREETGLQVITEVMHVRNIELVAEYADILQIGTRNMQNYEILEEVGKIRKPVMLKRGMTAKIEEWLQAAEYIVMGGNTQVMLCERGVRTFEPYTRNTLDLSAVLAVRELSHLPVIVDPSQGTGRSSMVPAMSKAAVAVGADGLIIEVHPNPEKALKDGAQSITIPAFNQLMVDLPAFAAAAGRSL
ncbi:MAG: 3-deoxy-7-phosphoheptulonate synthase [Capsulimonadaceae bacterium]|nr:3-deoxy-7-phosphoheptulonate synthase [Capsulimonadaceae bacterium]